MKFTLAPENNPALIALCGERNRFVQMLEEAGGVTVRNQGYVFSLTGDTGDDDKLVKVADLLRNTYAEILQGEILSAEKWHLKLRILRKGNMGVKTAVAISELYVGKQRIRPHTTNQAACLQTILSHDLTFCVGPAGTGKTFLAVATAAMMLKKGEVERIILVRPAVEAGEKLGFLPGDIAEKVDPYLRPLYDALYELLGVKTVEKLLREHVIEIVPLAFMRGRTLNSAFIILDESQNSTGEQMKMFLTRLGFGSRTVVTGDLTQIDLPHKKQSGLLQAVKILREEPEIGFSFFSPQDVVRHPLIQKIIEAYFNAEKADE